VGFGSNLGDPVANCRYGLDNLNRSCTCRVLEVSPLFRTEPVGFDGQDWFVNGCAAVATDLSAEDFLAELKALERIAGRKPGRPVNGPRELDMDILFFDDLVLESPDLVVPHPRLHKRRFVLVPLCAIAPELAHPVLGKTVTELLTGLEDDKRVRPCS